MKTGFSEAKPRFNRRTGEFKNCLVCEAEFWKYKSETNRRFCSSNCGNKFKTKYPKQDRTCKSCKKIFKFSEKPFSNSPGNYCSLKCRNDGYAKIIKVEPHANRPRWRAIRNKHVKLNNFCNSCGDKPKRIEVHHIEPYRVGKNDSSSNLVSLCHKCHSKEEMVSKKIARLPEPLRDIVVAIKQANFHDNWHLYKGREIENRNG